MTSVRFCVSLNARCDFLPHNRSCTSRSNSVAHSWVPSFQHDADAVACDAELSSMLKSAAYAAVRPLSGDEPDDLPVLMSGAGHDAMAMSHLTKVL